MRNDLDPVETSEWREAFDSVIDLTGRTVEFLLEELSGEAGAQRGAGAVLGEHPYLNTIPPHAQPPHRVTGRSSTGSGR